MFKEVHFGHIFAPFRPKKIKNQNFLHTQNLDHYLQSRFLEDRTNNMTKVAFSNRFCPLFPKIRPDFEFSCTTPTHIKYA